MLRLISVRFIPRYLQYSRQPGQVIGSLRITAESILPIFIPGLFSPLAMDSGFRQSRSKEVSIEIDPLRFLKNTRRSQSDHDRRNPVSRAPYIILGN